MKIQLVLILVQLSTFGYAQKTTFENTWYVESQTTNSSKKATITLSLDSLVKEIKGNKRLEYYSIKNDGSYFYSMGSWPVSSDIGAYTPAVGAYSEGKWTLNAQNELILTVTVNNKKYVHSYDLQWISNRKIRLVEK